ncbi:MAG: adenylate/guanylate cyclase domain-containing protein [Chloroflexota bacterium]
MTRTRKLSLQLILLVAVALALMLGQLAAATSEVHTPLQSMELAARDLMVRLRGRQVPSDEIVIVAIDDESFSWTGYQWPWPHAYLAEIVDALNRAEARVVGLDVTLFEADADPAGDEALARSIREARNFVALQQVFQTEQGGIIVTTIQRPREIFREGLDGEGLTSVVNDLDAITRRIQAFETYNGQAYFNWAFELARLQLGVDAPADPTPTSLTFNGRTVPLQGGRLIVNFAGPPGTYPTYPAYRVALGDYPPETFRDKIVLIGATTLTLQDLYPTPFSAQTRTAGVEIVANAVDTLLQEKYLRETPLWADLLSVAAAALLAAAINRSRRPARTVAMLAMVMVGYAAAGFVLFAARGLFIPVVGPEIMLFLGVTLPTVEQAVSQEREKRRVRNLFTRFISPEMVDQLIATQDINSLNKRANLSILFSDIRGFTTMSEKLPPEEVVALLNPYLEAMTEVIYRHGGTVDKYEGDAIIAFFGEPVPYADHALRAVRAALDMRTALDLLKKRWEAEGHPRPNLEMGVGIHSGEVFVGMLGSAQRINYTVIGDAANLASRLQDLTKTYKWPVLISEATQAQVKEEFDTEFADSTIVKGRTEAVNIYKLLGRRESEERLQSW